MQVVGSMLATGPRAVLIAYTMLDFYYTESEGGGGGGANCNRLDMTQPDITLFYMIRCG